MSNELSRITIVQTSNAEKIHLELDLSTATLADVKNELLVHLQQQQQYQQEQSLPNDYHDRSSNALLTTTIPATKTCINSIRLFHLGRELKSQQRSLEKLGIGRFRNYILHCHVVVVVLPTLQEPQYHHHQHPQQKDIMMMNGYPCGSHVGVGNTNSGISTTTTRSAPSLFSSPMLHPTLHPLVLVDVSPGGAEFDGATTTMMHFQQLQRHHDDIAGPDPTTAQPTTTATTTRRSTSSLRRGMRNLDNNQSNNPNSNKAVIDLLDDSEDDETGVPPVKRQRV